MIAAPEAVASGEGGGRCVEGPAKQIFLGTATPSNESCLVLSPSEDL